MISFFFNFTDILRSYQGLLQSEIKVTCHLKLRSSRFQKTASAFLEFFHNYMRRRLFIDYYNVASLLCSFFVVADKCDMPLGLEDDRVPDPKFRASSSASFYCAARNARLHQQRAGRNGGAWCSRVSNRKQWLQVDFGTDTVVTKVCTQGRQNSDQWVTSYYLSFSSRGQKFVTYKEGRQTKVDWETIALCVTV